MYYSPLSARRGFARENDARYALQRATIRYRAQGRDGRGLSLSCDREIESGLGYKPLGIGRGFRSAGEEQHASDRAPQS